MSSNRVVEAEQSKGSSRCAGQSFQWRIRALGAVPPKTVEVNDGCQQAVHSEAFLSSL